MQFTKRQTTAASQPAAFAEPTATAYAMADLSALHAIHSTALALLDRASLLALHASCKAWQRTTQAAVKESVKRTILQSIPALPQMDAYAWFPACARLHVYRSPGQSAACAWLLLVELVGGMDEDNSLVQSAPYLGQRFTVAYGSPSALNTAADMGEGWTMQASGQPTTLDRGRQFAQLTTTDKGPLVQHSDRSAPAHSVAEEKVEEKSEADSAGHSAGGDEEKVEAEAEGPLIDGPVFAGLTFCVSGAFSVSQGAMKALVEGEGGAVASNVNAAVDYLVTNQPGSGKYGEAEKKRKAVVTEAWVRASIDKRRLCKEHYLLKPDGTVPAQVAARSSSSKQSATSSSGAGKGKGGGGSKVFAGLTFCVSGAFQVSQAAMKKQLQDAGGKLASTVSAAVDYLICNEEGSTKYQAAEEKGKPVVTEEWVQASIEQGKLSKESEHFVFNPNEDEGGGEGGEGEEEEEEEDVNGADWLFNLTGVHPSRQFARLRNGSYALHRDAEWYSERGVTVARPGFVDNGINAVDVLRALVKEHRDELLSTEAELARLATPDSALVKLLTLDDWYHADGSKSQMPDALPTKEEALAEGSFPTRFDHQGRYNATCHAIAQCIVDGSAVHYHELVASGGLPPGNTHWSNWPEAGFHK